MVNSHAVRIALLTADDARNPRAWSGTPFYMARALRSQVGEPVFVGPLESYLLLALKAINRAVRILTGVQTLPAQSWPMARRYARLAERKLDEIGPDLIVAPAGSALLAALRTNLPVLYTSDTTARLMFDYNPQFTNLSARARREADELERTAIMRADLLVYPTNWAARSAIEDYDADPDKVHVLAYGANLAETPARESALAPRKPPTCRLLFVGTNWIYKGGAIAVDTFRSLRDAGVDVELTIVGCVPSRPIDDPDITVIPFLDKNDPVQRLRLSALYFQADFLVVPTRCECYGIVFCEASAHGVPSITTATGGVPDVVREGVNGHALPHRAQGADYAKLIQEIFADRDRLSRLRETSRNEFEQRLNWSVWGRKTAQLVQELLSSRSKSAALRTN
jgi:glycosyltransferase involved in cell wall biosynthesis